MRTFAARPCRTATAVAATALAVVAAVVTLSIDHAIDHVLAHPSLSGDPYDATYEPSTPASARRLDALPEVASWYTTRDETVEWNGTPVHARALGGDPRSARYVIGAGRAPAAPGEAIVGYSLVDGDGVRIGDRLALHSGARSGAFTVVGWYRETEDSGRVVALRDRPAGPLLGDADVAVQVSAAPGVSQTKLARALSALGGTVRLNRSDGAAMGPFRTAMAAMTALLAAVALAQLLATALATARERSRSTAILQAVGASRRQLAVSAAVAGACAAVCALAVGLPLGIWLQGVLGDLITSSVGIGPGAGPTPPLAAIAAAASLLGLLCVLASVAATSTTCRRRPA